MDKEQDEAVSVRMGEVTNNPRCQQIHSINNLQNPSRGSKTRSSSAHSREEGSRSFLRRCHLFLWPPTWRRSLWASKALSEYADPSSLDSAKCSTLPTARLGWDPSFTPLTMWLWDIFLICLCPLQYSAFSWLYLEHSSHLNFCWESPLTFHHTGPCLVSLVLGTFSEHCPTVSSPLYMLPPLGLPRTGLTTGSFVATLLLPARPSVLRCATWSKGTKQQSGQIVSASVPPF